MACHMQEWQFWLFYFWSYLHLFCFWNWLCVCSVSQIPFTVFCWYFVGMKNRRDDMSCTRMTTLPFLLLALSSFLIFDNDYALISCTLFKSNTLLNIFMILGRNVEQDWMTCHKQEWQLWLSYFWSYLPLYWNLILCLLCNTNTLQNILMVFGRNVEQDETMCRVQEWQLFLTFGVIFRCYIWHDYALISCLLCKSNTLWNIFMILSRNVEQD